MKMKLSVLFLFLVVVYFRNSSASTLCDAGFCRTYTINGGCPSTSNYCNINNATHTGITLPSPTVCNCCDYCMPFYGEGQDCSLGGAGDGTKIGRCGDGLTCVAEANGNFCRKMDASQYPCFAKQEDFDIRQTQGLVGALEMRPECDGKRKFAAFDCVPTQSCFCQSEDGERIFGEFLNRGSATTKNMRCGCSRYHVKMKSVVTFGLRFPTTGLRCSSDGNFNPWQCIDKICFCVDIVTGVVNRAYSIDLDKEPLSRLPCYDKSLDLFPETAKEPPFNFTSPCFEEMREKIDLILESEESGYNVDYFSTVKECLPDGTYGRVTLDSDRTKICVNERGDQIQDYHADPGTPGFDNMDCKCAVTNLLLSFNLEKPTCCRNGNFRTIQCRRGHCRCVDSDGRQTSLEQADVTQLPCYSEGWKDC